MADDAPGRDPSEDDPELDERWLNQFAVIVLAAMAAAILVLTVIVITSCSLTVEPPPTLAPLGVTTTTAWNDANHE